MQDAIEFHDRHQKICDQVRIIKRIQKTATNRNTHRLTDKKNKTKNGITTYETSEGDEGADQATECRGHPCSPLPVEGVSSVC